MKNLLSCLAIGLSLVSAAAWPDCVDGTRPATTEEQAFGSKLSASLKAAMPAAPAPLALVREPEVILRVTCSDTPVGRVAATATANYAASQIYSDQVKLIVRANYAYPGKDDLVLGSLPKNPAAFKVQNLVVAVDGYNAQYVESVKQAIDRSRLQALIDQPLPASPAPAAWQVGSAGATAAASAPESAPAAVPERADDAAPAATTDPQPKSTPAQSDVTKKTKDAVNKLRGLLGH